MKRKQIVTLTAALATASAILAVTTAAAYQYSMSDVRSLQDALLARTDVRAEDDVNGDGLVDAFDLSTLKRMLSADTGEVTESSYAATEEYVKLTGRTYHEEGVTWLVQSGSAAEFIVTGNSAVLTLAGDGGCYSGADYRPRYAVYVDGEMITDKTMDSTEETVTLFEGSTSRTAQVKVILLSEAMYGGIGVRSITANSSAAVPVKPAAKKDLCIEFIGDSITCAYGVEGASNSESFKTTTENFTKSYAYLTAQQLGADYSALCYSGHGIVSGYSQGDKNAESLIPDCYAQISKFSEHTGEWDFAKQQMDAVVINLGTNDINYVAAEPETRSAEFVEGYIAFLNTVRAKNPDAYIICTVGTMGGAEIYALIEEAVASYKTESSDERVMCYFSTTHTQADGYGSDWHPTAGTQQNSAYVLADKICQALGMESSQIGLNMAADSVYTATYNADSGANVYHYVNDYDKSFWINVSAGGNQPTDIQAFVPDLPLKEGCEYRLEFDYTSTVEVEIPFTVSGTADYHSDSITAGSDKLHYESTFTASEDDTAQIVFLLGGMDYYNVTFSNIKLVKLS